MLLPLLMNLGMFGAPTVAGKRRWVMPNGLKFYGTPQQAEAFNARIEEAARIVETEEKVAEFSLSPRPIPDVMLEETPPRLSMPSLTRQDEPDYDDLIRLLLLVS